MMAFYHARIVLVGQEFGPNAILHCTGFLLLGHDRRADTTGESIDKGTTGRIGLRDALPRIRRPGSKIRQRS